MAKVNINIGSWRWVLTVTLWSLIACLGAAIPTRAVADGYTFYPPEGGVIITQDDSKASPKCPDENDLFVKANNTGLGSFTDFELKCARAYLVFDSESSTSIGLLRTIFSELFGGGLLHSQPISATKSVRSIASHDVQALGVTPSVSLSLTTPSLPFLGNPLVMLGVAPDSVAPTGYAVGLRRQSDCSLVADFLNDPDSTTPNAVGVSSLPSAQDYFHQLSGLTTTADVFAKGCAYLILGQPSSTNVSLLGTTASGQIFGATASNGLVVFLLDPNANTFSSTTLLSSNALQGGIAAADLNADRNLDMVANNVTDPVTKQLGVAVLLGNSDGTFKPCLLYTSPSPRD